MLFAANLAACYPPNANPVHVMRTFPRSGSRLRVPQNCSRRAGQGVQRCWAVISSGISWSFIVLVTLLAERKSCRRHAECRAFQTTQAVSQSARLLDYFEEPSSRFPEKGGGSFPRLNTDCLPDTPDTPSAQVFLCPPCTHLSQTHLRIPSMIPLSVCRVTSRGDGQLSVWSADGRTGIGEAAQP